MGISKKYSPPKIIFFKDLDFNNQEFYIDLHNYLHIKYHYFSGRHYFCNHTLYNYSKLDLGVKCLFCEHKIPSQETILCDIIFFTNGEVQDNYLLYLSVIDYIQLSKSQELTHILNSSSDNNTVMQYITQIKSNKDVWRRSILPYDSGIKFLLSFYKD